MLKVECLAACPPLIPLEDPKHSYRCCRSMISTHPFHCGMIGMSPKTSCDLSKQTAQPTRSSEPLLLWKKGFGCNTSISSICLNFEVSGSCLHNMIRSHLFASIAGKSEAGGHMRAGLALRRIVHERKTGRGQRNLKAHSLPCFGLTTFRFSIL